MNPKYIRNIAIIAHVDHGKTTLVDAFLKQNNVFRDNQEEMKMDMILDSGELEREKGITIKAKNIAIKYTPQNSKDQYKINIIDTPGHADFGGEVERTLNMADGCILLVDAQEGPMPQTKFVLKKALELNLKLILVINKIDKPYQNAKKALSDVQDLVLSLASNEDQLEFPTFYAIGRDGKTWKEFPINMHDPADIKPLLEEIISYFPPPNGDIDGSFRMQITTLDFDTHTGRSLIGKIARGKVRKGDNLVIALPPKEEGGVNEIKEKGLVKKIMTREGLEYIEIDEATVGDIVAISGIESKSIGGTLCTPNAIEPLDNIKISEPSVRIKIEVNTSPFMGKEGKFVNAKQIEARLDKETETNLSLKIDKAEGGSYYVSGRGELQLSILLEELRREGFEFQVRRPEVIIKEVDGKKMEPLEELVIHVPSEYQGTVQAALAERRAELSDMRSDGDNFVFNYKILTRNLLGLRNKLLVETKGNVVMNNYLLDYIPFTEQSETYRRGVLISMETGVAMGYSLNTIQERGELFIEPGTKVYEGMIIGQNKFETDLEVNPTKERPKSGVRVKHDEITQTNLKAIKPITLDFALLYLKDDEILEVTPESLRLRKQYLTKHQRDWAKRDNLTDYAKQQMGLK